MSRYDSLAESLQLPDRVKMTQRIQIYLEDDFVEILRQKKPKSLSLSSFLGYCAEQYLKSLDTVPTVAPCPAHAGDRLYVNDSVYSKQKLLQEEAPISVSEKILPPPSVCGDGVGRECEGGKRQGVNWTPREYKQHLPSIKRTKTTSNREIRENLSKHAELIHEFWRVKKGSKSDKSWALLQTELTKIQEVFSDDRVEEQLQLAINGLWKGITLRNMQRFESPKEQQQPEVKHPASRVFTARDGFAEPVNNDVMRDLF